MADGDGHRPLGRDHVAAGEDAGAARHQVLADGHDPVVDLDPGHVLDQREVAILPEREHDRVRLELVEIAGRLREAGLVELHALDHQLALVGTLDRRQPAHQHALLGGLLDLDVVSGHLLAGPPVDDDRVLGAEPLRRPGGVHRRVAAAVDRHAPAQQRLLAGLDAVQHRDGVEDVSGRAGRDVGALADLGADGEERGVESLRRAPPRGRSPCCSARARRRDRGSGSPRRRGLARQPIAGDPEPHHPAAHRTGLADRHLDGRGAAGSRRRRAPTARRRRRAPACRTAHPGPAAPSRPRCRRRRGTARPS